MKAKLIIIFVLMFVGFSGYAQSLSGKEMFNGNCKACHSIGGGDIVGPDLAGISDRRDVDWIKRFVLNSQEMVNAGDEQAVEVFNKYNKIAMPPHKFSDEELDQLIGYIDEAGLEASAAKEQTEVATPKTGSSAELGVEEAGSSGMNFYVVVIMSFLGIIALTLSVIAGFLFRLLKS